jgi:oligopeptide/dipeptide ABC transporter ATP-binding protein
VNTSNTHGSSPLLEVRNLSLCFNNQEQAAVDRVSFRIAAGSTLGLVGASGAGKSSIARAILRLLKPDSGEILFKGQNTLQMDSKQLAATRQSIQLVFQDPSASLSPRRTVEQTLLEPLNHFAIRDTDYRQEKIRQILQTVGLDKAALRRYPHQFSSGQQQRIAIARALVTNPELLIADEAVASLDVSIQAQILQLIQTLQKEHGITFLFISHDLAVIRQIADDIAVMYRGQLMEQAPADIFFSKPAHPYSRTLLSFARHKDPLIPTGDTSTLQWSRPSTTGLPACTFAQHCPEKKPVCEHIEPLNHDIEHKNQPCLGQHCVKCHLYDEIETDET